MLVYVNRDDSRLVPEREEEGKRRRREGGICRRHEVKYFQKSFQTLEPFTYYICIKRQAERGLWFFLADVAGSLTTDEDQYRAAEVFERILHITETLLESDLLCDRCTVQTAAALIANAVSAAFGGLARCRVCRGHR